MRLIVFMAVVSLVAAACGAEADQPGSSTAATPPGSPTTTVAPSDPSPVPPTSPPGQVPEEPFVAGEFVRLDIPRLQADVSAADVDAVVRADGALGLDLLRVLAGEENLMLSPYSIATALSMLYPGARGTTASEIAAVLHLEVGDDTLHAVRNFLDRALAAEPPPREPEDTRVPIAIRPANSAWGQGGYPFVDDYLEVLASNYGAGLGLVDYVKDAEAAREAINEWVEDATEHRIMDLLP